MTSVYSEGAACTRPLHSEVRVRPTGSTSFQAVMTTYAKELNFVQTPTTYHCVNEDQPGGRKCVDMEIRFCCPSELEIGHCEHEGYDWTPVMNIDSPDGDGDWEMIESLPMGSVCPKPKAIRVDPVSAGSREFFHIDIEKGFNCVNEEQTNGETCADFQVQYCCPSTIIGHCDLKGYEWTDWLSDDTPDGTGDWELLSRFDPNQACSNPTGVKINDIGTGGSMEKYHLSLDGLFCINEEQSSGLCTDFAVSFCCPIQTDKSCETAACDGNEWCAETINGPVCKCGDDDYNIDPDDDDYFELEDGSCVASSTDSKTTETIDGVGNGFSNFVQSLNSKIQQLNQGDHQFQWLVF